MASCRQSSVCRVVGMALGTAVLAVACAGTSQLDGGRDPGRVLADLKARAGMVESAAYRVRWRASGTEPHGEFLVDIAYKSPDRFHLSAIGPFDIPAFTAVVVGDSFWFVDHRAGRLVVDQVANLPSYDVPMARFFSTSWRDIFAGGWGGGGTVPELVPGGNGHEYVGDTPFATWILNWDESHQVPRFARAVDPDDHRRVLAEVWFDRDGRQFPFWRLKALRVRGETQGGEHRWDILRQKYNTPLPDRLFERLSEPSRR